MWIIGDSMSKVALPTLNASATPFVSSHVIGLVLLADGWQQCVLIYVHLIVSRTSSVVVAVPNEIYQRCAGQSVQDNLNLTC